MADGANDGDGAVVFGVTRLEVCYQDEGLFVFDCLLGGNELRDGEFDPDEILPRWEKVSAEFRERSRAYWLYE